jgi:two-component system LytT family sensor kinase
MNDLLNLVGLSTGAALYLMLLVMIGGRVLRGGRAPLSAGAIRPSEPFDPLLLATAILGLAWNVCTLTADEWQKFGLGSAQPLSVVAFIALGFLPAVVVHSVVRGGSQRGSRAAGIAIISAAYGAGTIAAVLQVIGFARDHMVPSVAAMRLLTYCFVVLFVPLVLRTRRQPGSGRAFWAVALATFAVSALHLSHLREGVDAWPIAIVGHQASIPLALAILYEDYPFALADLFLKRALTLVLLIATAFAGLVAAGVQSGEVVAPSRIGVLTGLWVLTALAYPTVRRGIAWFVDSVVLARPDYASLEATIARRVQAYDRAELLLDDVCAVLTPALSASRVTWLERQTSTQGVPAPVPDDLGAPLVETTRGRSAQLTIPVSEGPDFLIAIHDLTGGRQLLSGDVAMLSSVARLVARRIDAIRLTRERYDQGVREQEMATLAAEAELRALRSQINPHFLFNALTTIGYLIQAAPERALQTLLRLTSLLRAVLRSEGEFTTLGHEVDLVESYLDIERARFEERLRVRIDVPAELRSISVPALLLQPLVENAVKHGIAPQRAGGEVTVTARAEFDGPGQGTLCLDVNDDGAGAIPAAFAQGQRAGVGLGNVRRRIAGYYGGSATMSVDSAPGSGTRVHITLPVTAPAAAATPRRAAQ